MDEKAKKKILDELDERIRNSQNWDNHDEEFVLSNFRQWFVEMFSKQQGIQ